MQAYLYQAALYCEDCGAKLCAELAKPEGFEQGNESSYDSDDYPKGPYSEGGGEADCPQHCDACGLFLENPLTPHGVAYVQAKLDAGTQGEGNAAVLAEWSEHYGLSGRHWFTSSCGHIELRIAMDDAESGSHPGPCDEDIEALAAVPYIAAQLAKLDSAKLAAELAEYGAWDETELADHDANLARILWLACGSIVEEARQ